MKKYRKFRTVNYTFSLTTNPNNYLLEVERNNSIGKSTIVFSNLDELNVHTFSGTIDRQVINIIEDLI